MKTTVSKDAVITAPCYTHMYTHMRTHMYTQVHSGQTDKEYGYLVNLTLATLQLIFKLAMRYSSIISNFYFSVQ